MMWHGEVGDKRSAAKAGTSCDSPSRCTWHESRDDMECVRDGAEISDDAMEKFDNMLKKIETERSKITTKEIRPRIGTLAMPRLNERRVAHSVGRDFAKRAMELRMSDGIPTRKTSVRSEFPHDGGRWESVTSSVLGATETPRSTHELPYQSAGSTPLRSFSPRRPSSPPRLSSLSTEYVNPFVDNDRVNRLIDRETEKDEYISILEQRNTSLSENLVTRQKHEQADLKDANSVKYKDEFERMRCEFDCFKKEAKEIRKRSAECDAKVEEIQREKKILVEGITDKDATIGILRQEIQRLSEELADGSFASGQALKAEETVKTLEAELVKIKEEHLSATKVIIDLEVRVQTMEKEFERGLAEKDKEVAALQLELSTYNTMKQNSEWMMDKAHTFESKLIEAKEKNTELSDQVNELTILLRRAEIEAKENSGKIKQLESSALKLEAREKELEEERRELELQRARVEKFDAGCASERETIAALEQAIADLEKAQNLSNDEITKLQKKNQTLSTTLDEAEEYMKLYEKDVERSRKLKDMMGELQDINTDLGQQLQEKNDHIRNLQGRLASIELQVQSSNTASQQAILHLERSLSQEQNTVSKLRDELSSSRLTVQDQEITAKKLEALSATFEQYEAELEYLRSNRREMQGTITRLEEEVNDVKTEAYKRSHSMECELESSQEGAKSAWARVRELEESLEKLHHKLELAEQQGDDKFEREEMKSELSSLREKLAERDEQLDDSRKGIAEAKKMIFRLMNTVQEVRRKSTENNPIESVSTDESSII